MEKKEINTIENKPSVEGIEPILLKHIIEHQREYLKPDLPDDTRRFNARWYLINSTPSYRGLIAGIKELISEAVAQRDIQLSNKQDLIDEYWKHEKEFVKVISERDKEIEGLKEMLRQIYNSVYIGKDLEESEILKWYIDVISVVKEEIRDLLSNGNKSDPYQK